MFTWTFNSVKKLDYLNHRLVWETRNLLTFKSSFMKPTWSTPSIWHPGTRWESKWSIFCSANSMKKMYGKPVCWWKNSSKRSKKKFRPKLKLAWSTSASLSTTNCSWQDRSVFHRISFRNLPTKRNRTRSSSQRIACVSWALWCIRSMPTITSWQSQ